MKKPLLIPVVLTTLLGAVGIVWATESYDHHAAPAVTQGISATGTVKSVDAAAGKLVIAHDPIPALKWPAMVMDFRLAEKTLAGKVKAGDKVKFELKEGDSAYLITAIEPMR